MARNFSSGNFLLSTQQGPTARSSNHHRPQDFAVVVTEHQQISPGGKKHAIKYFRRSIQKVEQPMGGAEKSPNYIELGVIGAGGKHEDWLQRGWSDQQGWGSETRRIWSGTITMVRVRVGLGS
jgi:hypothetical protein